MRVSAIPVILSMILCAAAASSAEMASLELAGSAQIESAGDSHFLLWADPLPEQFTATAVFSWSPRNAGDGVWAIGLSRSSEEPPTALALSLEVAEPPSWFGPMASVRITSDHAVLGPVATKVEPRDGKADREVYDTGFTTLIGAGEVYVATLSMDRRTGAASVRLATRSGKEIVSGHFRVPPQPGPVYAGFGGYGPLDPASTGTPALHAFSVQAGFERLGEPLAFQNRSVHMQIVRSENEKDALSGSPVVHGDAALTVKIFGAPWRVAGAYVVYVALPGGDQVELWRGTPESDAEPIRFSMPRLRPGKYKLVLAYVEPDYRLELASVNLNVILATVEAYIRQIGAQTGEVVLRSDRDLHDLQLEVTAFPGATVETEPAVSLWSGPVSLKAGVALSIPVEWAFRQPFEYAISYAYPEKIALSQAGRRIPADHPFLLVRQDQYEALQARAAAPPWSDMKREAEAIVTRFSYEGGADIRTRALALRDVLSAATLLYVLDPANRERHLLALEDAFARLPDLAKFRTPDPGSWDANVPVANALFAAILALDVVYYDLDPGRRREVEALIDSLVRENGQDAWTLSAYALRGTWALFTGDRTALERYKSLYKGALFSVLTEDGIFNQGPGYGMARFVNPDREHKHLFIDVLEFTGEERFYGDPALARLYEWLLAHSVAPDGRSFTFGDTSPVASLLDLPAGAALYRAHRFSETAGGYGAWWAGRMKRPGSFAAYILADRAPEPVRPAVSKIDPDGGAWFAHVADDGAGWLTGALWNPKSSGGHSHKDVNAVHLAAYGEHLVVNSGYRGWNQGGLGFSWTYLHDTAVSSNTVLIDGADHRLKHGAGIREGFVADRLMYARGDSGAALQNGVHIRDFVFVPPGEGAGGYWLLIDRVNSGGQAGTMSVALHPNSSQYATISEGLEYEWRVGGAKVTVFLATPPTSVRIDDGLLAGFGRSLVGKYLVSEYAASPGQALAVVFPHSASHPKATMERTLGAGYRGAWITHASGVRDIALELSGSGPVDVDGLQVKATMGLARRRGDALDFYFVTDGTVFREVRSGQGFAADEPVALFIEESRGWIHSPGAAVTFYGQGLTGVRLGGEAAEVEGGAGRVKVYVPPGTHSIELVR